MAIREEVVNTLLAELLRDRQVWATAERRSLEGVPDLRVELPGGDAVIAECKWADAAGPLKHQLSDRVGSFPEAIGVFGVLYPDRLRRAEDTRAELSGATDIRWWLHGSRGNIVLDPTVHCGSVAEFADHVCAIPLEMEGEDRLAAATDDIKNALTQSVNVLHSHSRIARRIADMIARTDQEKNYAAALHIGCLVLFNAIAFQDRLSVARPDVATVRESLRQDVPGMLDAWRRICDEIDYVPVFELAIDILEVLADGPDDIQNRGIAPLVRAVEKTRQLKGHDLSGRLFHTLLSDAKFTGAYYTSVPSATLLARLVFHDWPGGVDWSDHEFPSSLDVADLACGTGTLLMAVATEVERRHTAAGGGNAPKLHKSMVEQALHGYDVQLSAVHFAAVSLAMLNPDIQFDRMDLNVMPLGIEGSVVSLGSLDFLGKDTVAVQYALSVEHVGVGMQDPKRVSARGTRGALEGVTATLPVLDLAIMNPPFTRSVGGNLLFGSLPAQERRKLQKELSRRLKTRHASATAGLGAAFVAAASPRLRPGEGRLALVLPASVCTGPSWGPTRSLVERDFVLDIVIASHDPMRWNFSDSTDLSEALLIATRRPEKDARTERRTTFVNLWRNPDSVLDAHRVAQAVTSTTPAKLEETGTALLSVNNQHVGELVSIPESKIVGRQWIGLQFSRADVIRSALRLLENGEVWIAGESTTATIPLCQLDELGEIGPDRRDMWDGFARTEAVTAYPLIADHNTEQRKRLVTGPDTYLAPLAKHRPGRRLKPIDQLWPKAGRLFVAERLRLNTTRIVAMRSETKALSNVWWPINIGDISIEKALTVWLNSSLGLLTILTRRTSTEGGWVAVKKADLETLPVPDVRALSASQREHLSNLLDQLANSDFERLPAMSQCPARKALDDGLSRALGLPSLETLRVLLASEPVVSNARL